MKKVSHNLTRILFLDIETVPQCETYHDLPKRVKNLWSVKAKQISKYYDEDMTDEELYHEKAAIFAEFGKVVCISVGIYNYKNREFEFRKKSFCNTDEVELLEEFAKLISNHFYSKDRFQFCGHNIREFDIPYLCRRMLINKIPLPSPLEIAGKKPWELKHIVDTLQLWKFGDYKHSISLDLLCETLGIECPKCEMDGSQVADVFYNAEDLDSIAEYCEKDVEAVAKVYQALMQIQISQEYQSNLKIAG